MKLEVYYNEQGERVGYKMGKYYLTKARGRGEWTINTTGKRYYFMRDFKEGRHNGEIIGHTICGVKNGKRKLKELCAKEEQR